MKTRITPPISPLSFAICLVTVLGGLLVVNIASAHLLNGCDGNAPEAELHKITEVLFELGENMADQETNHHYNNYGCRPHNNPTKYDGYYGGHSGLDLQTKNVVHDKTIDVPFYSLTAGKVIKATKTATFSMIAIYDGKKTTSYIHARDIFVSKDQSVNVGTCLGIQGKIGNVTGVHVHVEVVDGYSVKAASGVEALPDKDAPAAEDPIRHLHNSVIRVVPKWDVNQDGVVNVLDLIRVWLSFGKSDPRYDVNCDKIINKLDLQAIFPHFGKSADLAAPAFEGVTIREGRADVGAMVISRETIQQLLHIVRDADLDLDVSLAFKRRIALLESILAAITPNKTVLLANYPNPFNPDTWIPYRLAKPAAVTLTLYDINGRAVRTLALGHQVAGFYESRSRAAYWDGRNGLGEPVASGVYFYTLTAGDFTATRKLLIRK